MKLMFPNRPFLIPLIFLTSTLVTNAAPNDPDSASNHYELGMRALRDGDHDTGIKELEKAVELAPDSSEYHRRLGDAYGMKAQNTGMFAAIKYAKKCKRSYEAAVEADPSNIGARWCLMDYCKEAPGFIGGSMQNAYAQADEIGKLDAPAGRWARATVLLKDNKPKAAFTLYEHALQAEPPDYVELFRLGRLSQWTGLHLEAGLQALDKCLLLTPPPGDDGHEDVQFSRGEILKLQNDRPAARLAYEAALELQPGMEQAAEALRQLK
jgi:tetratricopeptide (TPR) repeat protein